MTHFNTKDMEKKRKNTEPIQLRIKNYELKIKEK